MPRPHHAHPEATDVWSVEGRFQHLIYSPKGTVEGLLIDTDGVATQFVCEPHEEARWAGLWASLRVGQTLVIEGTAIEASPEHDAAHTVYRFERLATVDGDEHAPPSMSASTTGKVARLNFARHGEANGVVLDNGDFVHMRPDGFAALGLGIGNDVTAEGDARALAFGAGRVIEAREVNGQPIHH